MQKPQKVLICSAAWKESLSPMAANAIITKALQNQLPQVTTTALPLSDGGDGWLEVVGQLQPDAVQKSLYVTGALPSRKLEAKYLWSEAQQTAYIEGAEIHGMRRLMSGHRHPMITTSYGVGEALRAVSISHPECREIILSVGGSASVDGGMGFLQGLGWQFRNRLGQRMDFPLGGGTLLDIGTIQPPDIEQSLPPITLLVDVITVYPDAPMVFGPQKGARDDEIMQMTAGFDHVLTILGDEARQKAEETGTGAAGGLSFAITWALPQARQVTGMDWYRESVPLDAQLEAADWVITGEGRLDDTSLLGKGTGYLLQYAIAHHKLLIVFCGQNVMSEPLPPWVQVFPLYEADQVINHPVFQRCSADLETTVEGALSAILSAHA